MIRTSFAEFIFSTNTNGSGKAASYIRALDMLGPILTKHYPDAAAKSFFIVCEGQKMSLQVKFLPSQKLLEKHRELLVG